MLSCLLVAEEETNVDDADEHNVALARYSLCLQKYKNTKLNIARGTTDPGYYVRNLINLFKLKLFQIDFKSYI